MVKHVSWYPNEAVNFGNAPKRYRNSDIEQMMDEDISDYTSTVYHTMFPSSKTKTNTEEENSQMIEDEPVGIKSSYIKVSSGNPPVRRALSKRFEYCDAYEQVIAWNSNRKRIVPISSYGTANQYTSNTDQKNMSHYTFHRFFDFQMNNQVTGSTSLILPDDQSQNWMSISHVTHFMDILNESNLPCELKFTFYRCNDNLNDTVTQAYNDIVQVNQIFEQSFFVGSGPGILPTRGGGQSIISSVAEAPNVFESIDVVPYTKISSREELSKYWSHLKSHTIILAAGDVHRLTAVIGCNMFTSVANLNESRNFMKGCVQLVVSCQGFASNVRNTDTSGGQLAYEGRCLAAGKISIVHNRKFVLHPMKDTAARFDPIYVAKGSVVYNAPVPKASTINMTDVILQSGVTTA